MKPVVTGVDALQRMFAAMTEQTFQVQLGVADPPLIDYLVDLLVRFCRMDSVFRVRDTRGRRLEEVAEMLIEAENRTARPQREIYRHIGDFTLFWSGVYPEALKRMQAFDCKDHLLDYCEKGKQSYLMASRFDDEEFRETAPVLRRLSADFELCSYGLNRVRREWENTTPEDPPLLWDAEAN